MIAGIRRDPERAPRQCPCHTACGIAGYPITINIYPGQKVDSKLPEPLPGRHRADTGRARPPLLTGTAPPGRIPARVKYIAQRA